MSKDIHQRWYRHKSELRKRKHVNNYLQHAWDKYGEDDFEFEILEECEVDFLAVREVWWMKKLKSFKRRYGYNIVDKDERGKCTQAYRDHQRKKRLAYLSENPVRWYRVDLKSLEYELVNGVDVKRLWSPGNGVAYIQESRWVGDKTLLRLRGRYEKYLATQFAVTSVVLARSEDEYWEFPSISQACKFLYGSDVNTMVIRKAIDTRTRIGRKGKFVCYSFSSLSHMKENIALYERSYRRTIEGEYRKLADRVSLGG